MKKKIIAISLITTMVICNSTTVWATDTWSNDSGSNKYTIGSDEASSADRTDGTTYGEKDVTATFGLNSVNDTYSVEISWGALEFTPSGTLSGTWVAPDGEGGGGYFSVAGHNGTWTAASGADVITVTNKSNVDITATYTSAIVPNFTSAYILDPTNNPPALTLTNTSLDVLSPLNVTEGKSNVATNTVGVDATITKAPNANTNTVTLGTVTVTLAKKTS